MRCGALQKDLKLDGHQLRVARQVWKQTSEALVELEAKRGDILLQIYENDAANLGWQGSHLHVSLATPGIAVALTSAEALRGTNARSVPVDISSTGRSSLLRLNAEHFWST